MEQRDKNTNSIYELSKNIKEEVIKDVLEIITPQISQNTDTIHNANRIFEDNTNLKNTSFQLKMEAKIDTSQLEIKHMLKEYMAETKQLLEEKLDNELNEIRKELHKQEIMIHKNTERIDKMKMEMINKIHVYIMYAVVFLSIILSVFNFSKETSVNNSMIRIEENFNKKIKNDEIQIEKIDFIINKLTQD